MHPTKTFVFAGTPRPRMTKESAGTPRHGMTQKRKPQDDKESAGGLFLSDTELKTKPPNGGLYFWWPWSDSNRHSLQNLILSQARLPIPPRGQNAMRSGFISPLLSWHQPFSPGVHCDLPCALVSLLVFPGCQFFC